MSPESIALLLLVCLCSFVAVQAIQGEVVSCPGCKLNKLPEVRRFFKESGHADSYKNLKVTFIKGRNPDLYIKDENDVVLERIDLSKMTNVEIHALLISKGFERKEGASPFLVEDGAPTFKIAPNGGVPIADAVETSGSIVKEGTMTAGMPHLQSGAHRAGTGGRLRKRQESLMKTLAEVVNSDAKSADAAIE